MLKVLHLVIQCSQKVSFRPETGKIIFSYECRPNLFENSYRDRLIPKILGFFSFWGNSGPVSGRKLTFFDHCTFDENHALVMKITMVIRPARLFFAIFFGEFGP